MEEEVIDKINRSRYYNKFEPFIIFIKVDEGCNLKCSFCYQKTKQNFRLDTVEKLQKCVKNLDVGISKFLSLIKNPDYEYSQLYICFFGGEPTLNTEAINNTCDYLLEKYKANERNRFRLTYTTNGIIFNEKIKKTLKKMKSVNENHVKIMISTDNSKEVYDKNRKLLDTNKSGFEIVQKNILEYKKFLQRLNEGDYVDSVELSTVFATPEEINNNLENILVNHQNISRMNKFLYDINAQSDKYIEASNKFLENYYLNLINNVKKETKESALEEVFKVIFPIKDHKFSMSECQKLYTIDGNGDINWCNKHRNFGDKIISQKKMQKYIFNKKIDNSHFSCVDEKFKRGELTKNTLQKKAWECLISKFDMNVPIVKINILFEEEKHENIVHFIKYMLGSTISNEKIIYIKSPSKKIIELCKKYKIEISDKKLESDIENIFYLDSLGDLYYDEVFKTNKKMALTNIREKHFMWIHTPTLLGSLNEYFYKKLKGDQNGFEI